MLHWHQPFPLIILLWMKTPPPMWANSSNWRAAWAPWAIALLVHTANQILQHLLQHSPWARQCAMLLALIMLIPKFNMIVSSSLSSVAGDNPFRNVEIHHSEFKFDSKVANRGKMSITPAVDSLWVCILLVHWRFVKYSCIQKYSIVALINTECFPFD